MTTYNSNEAPLLIYAKPQLFKIVPTHIEASIEEGVGTYTTQITIVNLSNKLLHFKEFGQETNLEFCLEPKEEYIRVVEVYHADVGVYTDTYTYKAGLTDSVDNCILVGEYLEERSFVLTLTVTASPVIPDYTGDLKCLFRLDGKQPPSWQEGNVTMAFDPGLERWTGAFGDLGGIIYPPNSASNATADWLVAMAITLRGSYSAVLSGVTLRPADGYPSGDTGVQAMVGDPMAPPAAEGELIFGPSVF